MYDAVIVGGGIVGASAALSLGQQQYKILLIEQNPLSQSKLEADVEARTIALSYASCRIFTALGVWDAISEGAVPIQKVIVSMKGKYGTCRLTPSLEYEALGFVVAHKALEKILYEALASQSTVDILHDSKLLAKNAIGDGWQLRLNDESLVTCKLLIAADGVNSQLRDLLKIGCDFRQYHHEALLTNLEMADHFPFTALERFLPDGALAILPWQKNYVTCVWTTKEQEAHELKDCAQDIFLARCQKALGIRMGKIKACAKRVVIPLSMTLATQQVSARFMLLGNAAHHLHPIAAQGFNLSLRDIWQLRSQIIKSQAPCDLGEASFLSDYVASRARDQQNVIFATDKIARFMTGKVLPSTLRALGLTLFDTFSPLKNKFTQLAMGLS